MQAGFFQRFQRIDWLQPSVIALVLANLFPIAGVFLFHWDVFSLLFLFWLENVVIGIFNVLKMLLAGGVFNSSVFSKILEQRAAQASGKSSMASAPAILFFMWALKLFLSVFFCVHYGMFTFIHGTILVALFDGDAHHTLNFLNAPMIFQIIRENHLQWPLAGLIASHLISFGYDYLWRGEFRRTNVILQMVQPYGRIWLMQLTILIGGLLMMSLHSPIAGLVFLVCLKIIFDLHGHQKEREKFAPPESKVAGIIATQMEPVLASPEMARLKKISLIAGAIALLAIIPAIFGAWHFVKFFLPPSRTTSAISIVNASTVSAKMTNAVWNLDLSNTQIPDASAAGKFDGDDFVAARVILANGNLNIRESSGGNRAFVIYLHLPEDETPDGKSFVFSAGDTNAPEISMVRRENGARKIGAESFQNGYAMKLEFGSQIRNSISVKIYLCLPDADKSYLAGNFKAAIRKERN